MGYGSGIFLPQLSQYFQYVYGLDVHDQATMVSQNLSEIGVRAILTRGEGSRLPFQNETFDSVVAMSVLGYFAHLGQGLQELKRVLRPQGKLVLGFPTVHLYTRPLLRYYGRRTHHDLIQSVEEVFGDVRWIWFPSWLSRNRSLYLCCACEKIK